MCVNHAARAEFVPAELCFPCLVSPRMCLTVDQSLLTGLYWLQSWKCTNQKQTNKSSCSRRTRKKYPAFSQPLLQLPRAFLSNSQLILFNPEQPDLFESGPVLYRRLHRWEPVSVYSFVPLQPSRLARRSDEEGTKWVLV